MIHVGSGNYVNVDAVIAICDYDSNPIQRRVRAAEDHDRLVDATCGRKRKSVLFTNDGSVVLSCISSATLHKRLEGKGGEEDDSEQQ